MTPQLIGPSVPTGAMSVSNPGRTALWTENFAGGSLPANWAASGPSWTVSSGLISPASGQSFATAMVFSRYFATDERTIRIGFEILATGSVFAFGSWQSPDAYQANLSLFSVDAGAGTLNIYNGPGSNGATATVLASVALGFTMVTGTVYPFTVSIDHYAVTITVSDPLTGTIATVTSGTNSPSYNGCGLVQDYPAFFALGSGQFKVHSMEILANAVKPSVMFMGDSITFGATIDEPQRFASLVGAQVAGDSYLVSGRPGGTSEGALARITSELQYVAPKHLVLLIGTNDQGVGLSVATSISNITAAATAAAGYGTQVILCTVPTQSGQNHSTLNADILALGYPTVRFDLATSTGHDGVTQNSSLFGGDGTHPNAAGSIAMAARFAVDAPMVYD